MPGFKIKINKTSCNNCKLCTNILQNWLCMIKNLKRYFAVYIFVIFSILTVFCIFILIKQIEYKSSIKTFNAETLRRKNAIDHLEAAWE